MMRKGLTMILIFFITILISGCSSEQIEQQQEVEVENEIINENDETGEVIDTISKVDEKDEKVEEEEKIEEIEVIEEKSPVTYVLRSDHTVAPIEEGDEKVVLLTIDDAPDKFSVEMAKLLKERNVNAIFFVNGHFIKSDEGKAKLTEIYNMGFEIGNHTMTHENLSKIDEAKQREEIIALNDLIEEITGERPRFFRAPFGVNTDVSRQITAEENMQWMNWSYGYDFNKKYMEKEALADIMVNAPELRAGANLLMHDRKWTLEALPDIIEGLEEKGYQFVDPKAIK